MDDTLPSQPNLMHRFQIKRFIFLKFYSIVGERLGLKLCEFCEIFKNTNSVRQLQTAASA